MLKRREGAAVVVAAVMVFGVGTHPAHAGSPITYSVSCAGTQAWSFSTPLNEAFTSGTVSTSGTSVCTSTGQPASPVFEAHPAGSISFLGSCVVATFATGTYAGSGLLLGGAVAVGGSDSGSMLVELVPLTPCDESAAHGAAQSSYTFDLRQ